MSTTSEPHLACHHTGPEFDWWRCKEGGYVGRPPSPFPASFETSRVYRSDSSDSRYGKRNLTHKDNTNGNLAVGANGAAGGDTNGGTAGGTNGAACGVTKGSACGTTNVPNGWTSTNAATDGNTLPCQGDELYTYGDTGSDAHRLYWPIYQGYVGTEPLQIEDFGDIDSSAPTNKKGKKTPRLAHKRQPWVPSKMPNKWGVAGHPPPYTNYCRETLFNTRTTDPAKVVIKTTF